MVLLQEDGQKKKDIYLKVNGINNEAIEAIMKCAMHCKDYNDAVIKAAEEGTPEALDNLSEVQETKAENPQLFQQWKFPPLWDRCVKLNQHIDVAMHLIFLGVVKTTIIVIQDWTKMRGKHSAFLRYVKGALEPIQSLGIDWCRCVPYKTGKLGGWVSENYLGVSRLLGWLYCCIDEIASDEVFQEPLRHQSQWKAAENRGWLSIRGLNTKGTALELRQRVRVFMDQVGGPPQVIPPQGGPVTNVYDVVIGLQAMVS
jgi:hypothetical protein